MVCLLKFSSLLLRAHHHHCLQESLKVCTRQKCTILIEVHWSLEVRSTGVLILYEIRCAVCYVCIQKTTACCSTKYAKNYAQIRFHSLVRARAALEVGCVFEEHAFKFVVWRNYNMWRDILKRSTGFSAVGWYCHEVHMLKHCMLYQRHVMLCSSPISTFFWSQLQYLLGYGF